ncbi:hypothetical protein CsSME_00048109 [Camellia sinensis var. sinensis]
MTSREFVRSMASFKTKGINGSYLRSMICILEINPLGSHLGNNNLFTGRISNGAGTRSSSSVITEMNPYERAGDPSSFESVIMVLNPGIFPINGHDRNVINSDGRRSVMVTNTTVEIVVPENVIGSIYGENGSNLARLRQISGAKVIVHEPHPGATDRKVVISGTPDETQAAQSLLQAFILSGAS